MSIELAILKLFCSKREIEITHYGYIESLNNLEREIKLLFGLAHMYYQEYETDNINKDELLNFYTLKYPKAKDRAMHIDLIKTSFSLDVNIDIIKASLDQLVEKQTATTIVNKLIPVMEGSRFGVLETLGTDIDNYINLMYNPPDQLTIPIPCRLSVDELIHQEIMDEGYPWHLPALTEIVGGLRMKTLGLIYAYVDSGKTSCALSACASFAKALDIDQNICYAGNEESAPRLKLRLIQAFLNLTRTQIMAMGSEAEEQATALGLKKVHVFDDITTGEQLQYIVKEYQPKVLFVDQATDVDVNTKRKREGAEYLKSLFKWYRQLAIRNDLGLVAVSQGVGTANNTKWLGLADIYGSRVAIQGALDYAIGIGRDIDDITVEDLRYIHIPKNKLADGNGGKFTTHFERQRCCWTSV